MKFFFAWIGQDFTSWGISGPSATWAECMSWADMYLAEGVTTSLCFMVGG